MTCKVALMWDCYGLESAVRIDDFEKQRMLAILKGEDPNKIAVPLSLTMWQLRAQANMQRVYEIYIFSTEDDIEFKDIEDWMIGDPQSLVDWVRKNHTVKIYSDYVPDHSRAIV